jgi:hypothetical protein
MIKSFRGRLADGGQETIRLSTIRGEIGYRIVKFDIMPSDPNQNTVKYVTKIFTNKQDTIDDEVDFGNSELLAAATFNEAPGPQDQAAYENVIFDNVAINQDIFITNSEPSNNNAVNYYLELEQMKLDLNEATVATLKDMRGTR